jgi:hypothetical protein
MLKKRNVMAKEKPSNERVLELLDISAANSHLLKITIQESAASDFNFKQK